MKLYHREQYLKKIRPFYDDDLIKVITGIRRCGKSCLMAAIAEELRNRGVEDKDIIYLDLDKRGNRSIKTPEQLEKKIESLLADNDFKYLFIDEVQNVRDYEEVVNAYNSDGGFSIFITGSNSYLLSGELMTKLTGRYVEFEMFTLSFSEFLDMKRFMGKAVGDARIEFDEYLRYGGFPRSLEYEDPEAKARYIEDVVGQIVDKDIRSRNKIRNIDTFNRVMTYVINNYGAPTSLTNLHDYFTKTERIAVERRTIASYIQMLVDAKVLYRCERFDLKSRKSLRGEEKYYLADPGIYFARNIDVRLNYGPSLENALYIYLRSRGYKLSVGRIGKLECDFIARRRNAYAYIQVSMTIADRNVEEREYRPFGYIRDGYPRYLFTLDPLLQERDGVRHLNMVSFIKDGADLI
ncbi:ATP-binding protein [Collinsella sp. AF08-23]|uniref:ATP-binding protein n=1 Tax=Collinsella sp. AF08-23 TaxID=2292211 RepID=UPI000E53FEAA|nr:ATP-binding protein [Collinsella sp. AF08-23]RHS38803.1 ATP-binding protein [Collinsella sp. AF08-23]